MYLHYTSQAAEIGKEIAENFGVFTPRQLWLIVKLAKLARRSCKQNVAFNNAFRSAFPYASFNPVPKTNQNGKVYQGLEITIKDVSYSEDTIDEEDSK